MRRVSLQWLSVGKPDTLTEGEEGLVDGQEALSWELAMCLCRVREASQGKVSEDGKHGWAHTCAQQFSYPSTST